jgi:hypothetical protein
VDILMLILDRISCTRWDIQNDITTYCVLWLLYRMDLTMNEVRLRASPASLLILILFCLPLKL